MRESILVVEDNQIEADLLAEFLQQKGFEVDVAYNGAEGINRIGEIFYDVVITDLAMPKIGGLEVLEYIVEHSPETICIILTGQGSIKSAVEAIKKGAYEYLTKPVAFDELSLTLEKALDTRRLRRENEYLRRKLWQESGYGEIIGKSKPMRQVFSLIEKVADTDATVLVLGESGTGKELVARAIHAASSRREGPFIPVNCGAIPEELLESELFGHEKGSFTGAVKTRIGRFELAHGGTIFLDEIAEMSPKLQVKLLRVLQERSFERVGGTRSIKVDIRVIAATNKDLQKEVREGRFREDLYYRLNVIPIKLPPLRERKEDIPLLIEHFLSRFTQRKRRKITGLSKEALECLMKYHWPGNVRELENVIERMVILANGEQLILEDVPEYILEQSQFNYKPGVQDFDIPDEGIHLPELVSEFEKKLIIKALEKTGWVKNRAAKLLHINRTTLIEKMKKQKITRPTAH
ncbi:two component, sigma54 specific, transcriptional regulator, Fis family [Thermodesulfatator indicus DSM 15286]|uniref:Two component, sigma54 specific, transcriptional regulator, Fis family n=1 Tax=Thermodesulfatator indicus (strain DSM 15286 / JCM 11887 / CIR29812) TaxID=667014 RepID=F8ABW9_THEID|nr:sigma-54 dependent transcriptional regulator [Thermodesulfatator indicus]AEH45661.1 two component, sigma54 specific, transcriptional regulator, Fis family [Thermodesulfatator indicus DSM 15286]